MSSAVLLQEITQTYQKFGWTLRRVFLTLNARAEFAHALNFLDDSVSIENSVVNALLFSRTPNASRETWELRYLSDTPFALLETFAPSDSPLERAERITALLEKMRANVSKIKI